MRKIKCMIFDFGGVIGLPHEMKYVDEIARVIGVDKEKWLPAYFEQRAEYDRGITSSREYWESVLSQFDVTLSDEEIERLVELDFKSWTQRNEKTIEWIHELSREGYKLVLLSNINYGVLPYVEEAFDCLKFFDQLFYSCDMKLLKPDERIYRQVLDDIHIEADKCVFIDDSLANVEGARSVGFHGVQFTDFETTKSVVDLLILGEKTRRIKYGT